MVKFILNVCKYIKVEGWRLFYFWNFLFYIYSNKCIKLTIKMKYVQKLISSQFIYNII